MDLRRPSTRNSDCTRLEATNAELMFTTEDFHSFGDAKPNVPSRKSAKTSQIRRQIAVNDSTEKERGKFREHVKSTTESTS